VSVESELRNEESASQLSAMFDGELAAAECELLSRRLGRDEALRARWARYAVIGAALRSEPVSPVTRDFSRRVGAAIDAGDAAMAADSARAERKSWLRTLASGTALAAGIAAAAVLVLRNQVAVQDEALAAITPTAQRVPANAAAANTAVLMPAETLAIAGVDRSRLVHAPRDYVVPFVSGGGAVTAPASLASYVTAHSEYSSPLVRGGLISHLVVAEQPVVLTPVARGAADDEVVIAANDGR
jgi:negative regulator of sigma E activity